MPKRAPGELERNLGQGMEGQDTGNDFPLPEGRVRWDVGKELFSVREQVAPRDGGCPIPKNNQCQVGQGSEQPDIS